MKALAFLLSLRPALPMGLDNKPASNSEVRRWLSNGAVEINGNRPKAEDIIAFPVTSLIFFPNGKKRCTLR